VEKKPRLKGRGIKNRGEDSILKGLTLHQLGGNRINFNTGTREEIKGSTNRKKGGR